MRKSSVLLTLYLDFSLPVTSWQSDSSCASGTVPPFPLLSPLCLFSRRPPPTGYHFFIPPVCSLFGPAYSTFPSQATLEFSSSPQP